MKKHYLKKQQRPSLGFVIALGSYLLLGGFLLWASTPPELSQLHQLHNRLYTGTQIVDQPTLQQLDQAFTRHPQLAETWRGKANWLIVTPERKGRLLTNSALILLDPNAQGQIWAQSPTSLIIHWGAVGQAHHSLALPAHTPQLLPHSSYQAWYLQAPADREITLTWKENAS